MTIAVIRLIRKCVDVPMVDVPSATSVSISGPSSSVAEGDEAVFSVGTASAGSVDLVIG